MAQAPIPTTHKPAATHAAHSDKPALPPGAPTVMRKGILVAVGTVIISDKDGKNRQIIDHGMPIPDGVDTKDLEKKGAAAKYAPPTPAPGVEAAKPAEWTYDEKRGVWLDEHGGMHAPAPPAQDSGKDDDD